MRNHPNGSCTFYINFKIYKNAKNIHTIYICIYYELFGWNGIMITFPNLIVDPPGRAFLQKDVETVIKGDSLTLTCGVDELGRPRAKEYIWRMGGKVVNHVSSSNWTIDPVTLETEGNISCVAKNPVGLGIPDFIDVEVFGKFCSISI